MIFDPNCKDIRPLYLASVHNGEIEYRQTSMEKAYARIGEDGVQYAGPRLPDRATSDVKLAVFGPKTDALIHSPATAALLDQLNRNATHHISLIGIPSDVQWGKPSSALVQALYDQHAIGIIATSRDSSHLAEQLGVKNFVPVIAISSDHSLTSTNIPWIFRLPEESSPDLAIRCFADAIHKAGPNRESVRNVLASGSAVAGLSFQNTGEPR
jgi:hypothetical protein